MLNSNTFYKIISVLVAIVLWAYVIQVTEPVKNQTIQDVPVQLLNEESLAASGLALSGEASYTVDVEIQAKRAELTKISAGDILAEANLFGYSMGKNYIPITVTAPDGITILAVKPIKIDVVIEEMVEVAKPIRIAFIGQFAEGIEAGQITTQPEEVLVSGAKSEVSAVAYVKAEVNTSNLTMESGTIQAKAVAVNSGGDVVQNVRLSSAFIDVTAKLCEVKEVPLTVDITGEVAQIYEVTSLDIPDSVKIKGTKEALAAVTGLTGTAIDISTVSSTSKLPIDISLPEGVEFATGYENLAVNIAIKPVATKQFTYTADEIQLEGIDGISSITITTPQITVTASGSEVVIAGLKKEDIEPYLELDAESLISATAKVQVRYDKTLGHIAVDPEEVHITLNQSE
ncbi:MAG TPA: CdaR family protein, partial [Anaerovoracaceae bacterium]|nr:CdaR family protein [Anaerovoracaceae bacterium]